jgi:phospholipase/lecithinase/hemolysin
MELFTMFVAYSSAALMLLLSFPLATATNHNVPAFFIFGDSLADAGNNNFIANTTAKANFTPYGETFFHRPTGRFSNGRTAFDFIATKLRLPFPPPYLKPHSDFSHGINFASGGSGLLDSTGNYLNIIPLSLQISQFANYSSRLGQKLGGDYNAKEYLSRSLYAISSVGNDIGLNYLANTTFQRTTSAQDFVKLLLSKYNEHVLSLYSKGARNFILIDSPLVGCSPNSRLAGMKADNGGCLETANQLAVAYNDGLKQLINNLNKKLDGATILLANAYDFVLNIIQHGEFYGFRNTTSACCGAGPFNTAVSCGLEIPKDKRGEYTAFLCKRPDKYVFWDGTHPTEKVYRMVSRQIWHGNTSFITPFNLKTLLRKH